MSYAEVVNTSAAWYELNYADDYIGAVRTMETLTVFPQNVMVADTKGNIYYQRTGRVPIRPEGYDFTVPVDGSTSKTEWTGIHLSADHLQTLNPPQGYMQNCNVPPDAMMQNSPFKYGSVPNYLYGGPGYTHSRFGGAIHGWTNQRGARAIELLYKNDSVTVDDAKSIINDVQPYGVKRWLEALMRAYETGPQLSDQMAKELKRLYLWGGHLHASSQQALLYYYWRAQLIEDLGGAIVPWKYRNLLMTGTILSRIAPQKSPFLKPVR
jgi:acyl-homoserine-lactone acylase